jgi:hypothetical protein
MADWACVLCGAPPKDGSLAVMLVTNYAEGVCSNLDCKTRKLKKIKLRSGVRGAEYADATGKATFRRTHE